MNHNADTYEDVYDYYVVRGNQLIFNGFAPWHTQLFSYPNSQDTQGYYTYFIKDDEVYISFYLLDSHRGKGVFDKFLKDRWKNNKVTFVTFPSCNLVDYFTKKNIPYYLANEF